LCLVRCVPCRRNLHCSSAPRQTASAVSYTHLDVYKRQHLTRTVDSVSIAGPQPLHAIDAAVPGDISSAAFFLCAAALFPGSSLVLDAIGLNPTRASLLDVLTVLGVHIAVIEIEEKHAELIGTVQVTAPEHGLRSTEISGALAAQLIDCLLYTSSSSLLVKGSQLFASV